MDLLQHQRANHLCAGAPLCDGHPERDEGEGAQAAHRFAQLQQRAAHAADIGTVNVARRLRGSHEGGGKLRWEFTHAARLGAGAIRVNGWLIERLMCI